MKSFKKLFKILLLNLIAIVILLFSLNWIIYKFFYQDLEFGYRKHYEGYNKEDFIEPFSFKRQELTDEMINNLYINREFVGTEYQNKAIIMFGCSYAYGLPLELNQTLQYKLSHQIKRPIYNFSSPGQSPQFALMRIQSHELDNYIKDTEYVIYTIIGEHVWRLHTNSNGFPQEFIWPRYEKKRVNGNDVLIRHKSYIPFFEGSYLYKYIEKIFFAKILAPSPSEKVQNYLFDFMKLHLESIRNEIRKINPEIKTIILIYPDSKEPEPFTNSKRWKELEADGFIIVDIGEIIENHFEEEYRVPNDGHPSELAWDIIRDKLVNDFKIFEK